MATQLRPSEAFPNASGVQPLDLRVVVMPDAVEQKSAGGIIIPDTTQDREKYATVKATLIAVGENAWEEAAARSTLFHKPLPGARVMIAKYGGVLFKGPDGADYRILNDVDVVATLVED
jgi:chaperonin GroES